MLIGVLLFIGLAYSWVPLIITIVGLLVILKHHQEGDMPNPIYWFEVYAFSISLIGVLCAVLDKFYIIN